MVIMQTAISAFSFLKISNVASQNTSCVYLITSFMVSRYYVMNILKISSNSMREEENLTRQSSETNVWSEEHQVYYYSSFDLFNSTQSEEEFYQFSIFIEKVYTELGFEWRIEANSLFAPHLGSRQVFMNLLQLWLRYHPPVNSLKSSNSKMTTFNQAYVSQFLQMMEAQLSMKHPNLKIQPPLTSMKAVCLGFFMTANQIWGEMFQAQSTPKRLEAFSANNLIKDITNKIEKTFRPLMVVTEKISSVFGKKKRKYNEEINQQDCDQSKFQNCYHQFRRTLDIEKQLERKMSDFNLEDYEPQTKNKIIQKKEFKEADSPIQASLISNLYSYVTDFLNRNPSWQVASNFVTQILELNQVRLEQGLKVKVMRPAQDFYCKLVMVWLVCQKNSSETMPFQNYLNRLKSTFFVDSWSEKYLVPTKYFYERMKHDWEQIKLENNSNTMNEKEVLNSFIRRVKRSMKLDWDHKIQINKEKVV